MRYTTRPLSDRTWLRSELKRKRSQFDTTWTKTLDLLGREIDHLGGHDVVIEVDVREQDIRIDGMLRANARSDSPAVVVAFDTRDHGPMLYRCDRYVAQWHDQGPDWQHNVRAIALTLEALRAVDRYGATETGQQYTGFKALPGGATPMPAGDQGMTRTHAQAVVLALGGFTEWPASDIGVKALVKRARRSAHPDANAGDHTEAYELDEALRVLGLA